MQFNDQYLKTNLPIESRSVEHFEDQCPMNHLKLNSNMRNPVRRFQVVDAEGAIEIACEAINELLERNQAYVVTQGEVMSFIRREFDEQFEADCKYPIGEMLKILPKYAKEISKYWIYGKPSDLELFFAYSGLFEIVQDDVNRRMKTFGSL